MTITKGASKSHQSIPVSWGKHQQLNRFLSKTYHMVNNSDIDVVSWSPSGDSFLVKDVESFSENVLPLYFKHSKFSSFVRQLNFYGFRKIRPDCSALDEESGIMASVVRFYHRFFQANRPELLLKINRTTKSPDLDSTSTTTPHQVESLQTEVEILKDRLSSVTDEMEAKMQEMKKSLELEYQLRVSNLETAMNDVLASILRERLVSPPPPSTTSIGASISAASLSHRLSPILALSSSNGGHHSSEVLKSLGGHGTLLGAPTATAPEHLRALLG